MKITKQQWMIIGVVVAIILVWYFFLKKKKSESNYRAIRIIRGPSGAASGGGATGGTTGGTGTGATTTGPVYVTAPPTGIVTGIVDVSGSAPTGGLRSAPVYTSSTDYIVGSTTSPRCNPGCRWVTALQTCLCSDSVTGSTQPQLQL